MTTKRTRKWDCRIADQGAPDVLIAVLGDVRSPLSQGAFDIRKDEVVCASGKTIRNYYKQRLGFPYFTPIDKSVFKTPLTGWLSWNYYDRDVTPEEVLANARWLAAHLREYGVTVVLIDDGWEKEARDWEGVRPAFSRGMQWLAREISKTGLVPGLWVCPQGQDNPDVIRRSGAFLLKPDGASVCGTMGGAYTVDPTKPAGARYVRDLIRRITRDWGYKFLKLDGICSMPGTTYGVLAAYHTHHADLADQSVSGDQAFRRFMKSIRASAGHKVHINGCSVGVYHPVVGVCDSVRTGYDTYADWDNGFMRAVQTTMDGYFMHNVGWYSDPDCCIVRPPLSLDMARAWATLYGITGQMLMFDDRMPDLGPARVELLKKVAPPADIRPFDLFPARRCKELFDLKVARQGRVYDVVAGFNYDERAGRTVRIDFKAIGLSGAKAYHVYDFWARDYLGLCRGGVFVDIPPAACRVVTLYPDGHFPVLLSTDRHIVQGWPDLDAYAEDRKQSALRGISRVIAGEPYTLTVGLPNDGKQTWAVVGVKVAGVSRPELTQGRGVACIRWVPRISGTTRWQVRVRRTPMVKPIPIAAWAFMLGARDVDPWTIELFWVSYSSPAGFVVAMDGRRLGHVFGFHCRVNNLEYGREYEFEVTAADLDGRVGARSNRFRVKVGATLPEWMQASDLEWSEATTGYLTVRRDKSVGGASLGVGGRRYAKGIGAHPSSQVVYALNGDCERMQGAAGIEDQNGMPADTPHAASGQAEFRVEGDGRVLWGPVKKVHGETAVPFDINIQGVRKLTLRVERPNGVTVNHAPHANWLDLRFALRRMDP